MPAHDADWRRRDQPLLSGLTTAEEWCQVQLYSPAVVRARGGYRMWYAGCSDRTREGVMHLGLAESEDGVEFEPHPDNPVLCADDLPWATVWQTPHVHHDGGRYRMWFVGIDREREDRQRLGYAESADGVEWDVHPEPLYHSARGPCVHRTDDGYVMWANSAPGPGGPDAEHSLSPIVQFVYRFTSPNGIDWTRDPEPAVTTSGRVRSLVYPEVVETGEGYAMFYGSHLHGDCFEIHCATSADGREWTRHHDAAAFPATRDENDFDGRYTSTPCVLVGDDRARMYYSARDWGNLYGAGDGTVRHDAQGIYRHIGLAEADSEELV
ncbi:MAG: hypothetical protein ABEH77_01695 [Halobacteriaceae archaeon]